MNHFWDFMGKYVGPGIAWAFGIVVLLLILYYFLGFVGGTVWVFTVELYRALRYDRHGVCYKCKQRYVEKVVRHADQTYGADEVSQWVCPNGHVSLIHGNRRYADWAGF